MNKKRLLLGEPIVVTYNYEAFPLSILAAYGENYLKWIYCNYIQLNAHRNIKKYGDVFLAFYDNQGIKSPFLKTQNVKWTSLSSLDINLHSFIKTHINLEYYLYFQVDEYYVPERGAFGKRHYIHDLLLFGYDDDKETYNIAGYNQEGLYTISKISYIQFENAFYANNIDKEENEWADNIYLFKYNSKYDYKFNIKLLKKLMSDYLNSTNSFEEYKRYDNPQADTVYGLEVYNKIVEYLHYLKAGEQPFTQYGIDNRIFRLIKEHKLIMLERLHYINDYIIYIEDLIEKYKDVLDITNKCHILAIKYRLLPKERILDKLLNYIVIVKQADEDILSELLHKLE